MATYGEVLAEPRFRLLFATRTVAIAAETLRIVALAVLVFATTRSPLLSALTYGLGFLPQLFGSVLFGAVSDRVRPRRLLVAGYLAEAGAALVLGAAHLPVWACLAVVATLGCATPIFGGAASRLVSDLLTGDAYVLGRSLFNMSSSGAQLLGLAGGGLAVATLGARPAIGVCAAAHALAAVAVWRRLPDSATPAVDAAVVAACGCAGVGVGGSGGDRRPDNRRGRLRAAVRGSAAGNLDLLRDARIRVLFLAQWLPPAFVSGADGLLVAYCTARGFPPATLGPLLAAGPIGMIIGDVAVARLLRPAVRERLVPALIVLLGLPLVAFAVAPPRWAVLLLLGVAGGGFAYGLGLQRRFLEVLPAQRRGQAFGFLSAGLMTVQGTGPVVFGAVAEAVPIGWAIASAGAVTVVTGLVLERRLSPRPRRRVPALRRSTPSAGSEPILVDGAPSGRRDS